MTAICGALAEELTERARQADDPIERGLTSIAAAIAAGFSAQAHERRRLSVDSETMGGAVEFVQEQANAGVLRLVALT
jgi:hypothetical protein